MSIKSILCLYSGESFESAALEAACHLAKKTSADLRILHVMTPIVSYLDVYGSDAVAMEKKGIERAESAETQARDIAHKTHLPFGHNPAEHPLPAAIFDTVSGDIKDLAPAAGRACDLIVLGRADPDVSDNIEAHLVALLDVGTPVLIVPSLAKAANRFATPGQKVALAWDGSASAGQALRSLELILSPGQEVEVICIRLRGREAPVCPPEDAAHWLELHGFAAHIVPSGPFAMSTGEAILMNAHLAKADVLVMGAYGHSHLREMFIGGVTDHVLKRSDLPMLLCH